MEEKLQRVTSWLKKIYGNQPIPQYEVNARTVDILYEIVECNEARDRDVSLLIEDMKQRTTEYEAEAAYLQRLLTESLGLSLSSLSSEGTSHLNVLVNSAMTLETKDTSLASFFCAINDTTSELYTTELKNREMELELTNIRKKLTAALMLEKQLEEDLKKTDELLEVEKAKADSRSQNLKFLKDKSEDLKIRIKAAEEQLAATGLDQSLTHESLVSLSEKLAGLQEEIGPLKKKLESYLDLTPAVNMVDTAHGSEAGALSKIGKIMKSTKCKNCPLNKYSTCNPSLAQVKIEEVKRELNALEAEFSKQIDVLTLEMPETGKLPFS